MVRSGIHSGRAVRVAGSRQAPPDSMVARPAADAAHSGTSADRPCALEPVVELSDLWSGGPPPLNTTNFPYYGRELAARARVGSRLRDRRRRFYQLGHPPD